MDKLLAAVLVAHGGLQEWGKAAQLTARMSFGGPFWGARGWPSVYDDVTDFTSAAVWNYMVEPFEFARSDIDAREIEPWTERGKT